MANYRMLPPQAEGSQTVIHPSGRTYTCALGSYLDVPDFDRHILVGNGWVELAEVGTTAQRPTTNLKPGKLYIDTTLAYGIIYDGALWRNVSGTSV